MISTTGLVALAVAFLRSIDSARHWLVLSSAVVKLHYLEGRRGGGGGAEKRTCLKRWESPASGWLSPRRWAYSSACGVSARTPWLATVYPMPKVLYDSTPDGRQSVQCRFKYGPTSERVLCREFHLTYLSSTRESSFHGERSLVPRACCVHPTAVSPAARARAPSWCSRSSRTSASTS